MIRVTPIGGEPVELPEETECIGHHDRHGEVIEVLDVDSSDGEDGDTTARVRFPKSGQVEFRLVSTLTRATLSRPYFVHIGDAWPLCEIETWRQRAERLERELEALRSATEAIREHVSEWEYEDRGYDYNACPSCNWNTRADRTDAVRLGHHDGCKLRAALDALERLTAAASDP